MKYFCTCILLLISTSALSVEYPSIEEFYKNPENTEKYNGLELMAHFDILRQNLDEDCVKSRDEGFCNCASNYMNAEVSNEEIYYESVITNQLFNDKVLARREKNEVKLNELEAYEANFNGISKRIEKACPIN
jgi:hypothetical protein